MEKGKYESEIKPKIKELKTECFKNENVILHEIDIRKKEGDFKSITKEEQETFFAKLNNFFVETNSFNILAVSINVIDLNKLYKPDDTNDLYNIALQLLMHNYKISFIC